jgi:hypothetical protein
MQKIKKLFQFLFLVCFCVGFRSFSSPALATYVDPNGPHLTISGTISLPAGRVAPVGGISGYVNAVNGFETWNEAAFVISEGTNSMEYSIMMPPEPQGAEYWDNYGCQVNYRLVDNDSGKYLDTGYYSASGTVKDNELASRVELLQPEYHFMVFKNADGINLSLIPSKTISGTITLPNDTFAPTGGIGGVVNTYSAGGTLVDSVRFDIPQGDKYVGYSASVPDGDGYKVNYLLDDGYDGYLTKGYYSTGVTNWNSVSASSIDVSTNDASGINLTLLGILHGTILLPQGMTVPEGGINGYVYIQTDQIVKIVNFYISEGGNSAIYSAAVPLDVAGGFSVSYQLYDNYGRYFTSGYYSSSGTVRDMYSASLVNVSTSGASETDLTLIPGKIISGTVSLPQGDVAPAGGINEVVRIFPLDGPYEVAGFNIPEGGNSANYSAVLPLDAASQVYRVYYVLDNEYESYIKYGYYSTTGTTGWWDSSSLVDVSSNDASGINLTLLQRKIISGTVSLPQGMVAPVGGIDGALQIGDAINDYGLIVNEDFHIPEGGNSATYSAEVPKNVAGGGYIVEYYLDFNDYGEYENGGYYSAAGTTLNSESASRVDVSADDALGINLTLLTLELPGGDISTITSDEYTVDTETITDVPFGTSKTTFLAALTKGQANQIWDSDGLHSTVISGDTFVVTAQDGTIKTTYTVTTNADVTNYNAALAAVHEADYTTAAWATYQGIVGANEVTDHNTQAEIDTATENIIAAQGDLLGLNQTIPDGEGNVILSGETTEVVITDPDHAVDITIANGTNNPKIDVSDFITDGVGTLPEITIGSDVADVAISSHTTVTSADSNWDGVIAAPTATTITLPDISGSTRTVSEAIEVGFTGAMLSFDKAVRILLPNQAGKRAGYSRNGGVFTEITNICSADNQDAGDALAPDGDCKIDDVVGNNLVIWTKHFTTFATYMQKDIAATPTTSLAGGTYTSNQSVTLSTSTSGATIYYTIDGSTPTTSSAVYTSPLSITGATTLKAIAIKTGMTNSGVMSKIYTISIPQVVAPTASPAGGTYNSNQSVTLSTTTSGAMIHYTTDGSTPTSSSATYSSPLSISGATTLKAIAVKSGMNDSSVMTEAYNVQVTTNTPTLTYSTSKKVKRNITFTFKNLTLIKKKYVKVRLNGRKVTVAKVRISGNDSLVTVTLKYGKWSTGNYTLVMSYKNQIKIPYLKKGKTKYRKGWASGSVISENIFSII